MNTLQRLLLSNKSWAQQRRQEDAHFFERLAREQRPEILWIGCSDSRVPANQITGTDLGEIFVHRNVANMVHPADTNLASVLQYSIEVLGVQHIIVCGHSGCGGVKASMGELPVGPVGEWLTPLRGIYEKNRQQIDQLRADEQSDRLCELNVRAQVQALTLSPIVRGAWKRRAGPTLHGWMYALTDGLLRELLVRSPEA